MIGIVACSKTKSDHAGPALELYTSPLFRLSVRYAIQHCEHVYIVSAKHGLVDLEDVLEPYDVTVRGMAKREREMWAADVARSLFKRHATDFREQTLCAMAGVEYLDPIFKAYTSSYGQLATIEPLKGMQIGARLSWLTSQLTKAAA